jgi:hypothetical protein
MAKVVKAPSGLMKTIVGMCTQELAGPLSMLGRIQIGMLKLALTPEVRSQESISKPAKSYLAFCTPKRSTK